jgi:hypothetical protein
METLKKFAAEVFAVVKADPRVRKASAAFYATEIAGLLAAASDLHVTGAEVSAATVAAVAAASAAWKATNKRLAA